MKIGSTVLWISYLIYNLEMVAGAVGAMGTMDTVGTMGTVGAMGTVEATLSTPI